MLLDKIQGTAELRHYNPLRARIGSSLMINELDLKELNFFVKEIREYQRRIGVQQFTFVDYVLLARPLDQEDVWARLRLVPVEGVEAERQSHHALVLRLYDEFAHDEAFLKVVNDTTRKFEVVEEGKVTEEYWRINDVTDPYQAQVAVMKDTNNDGTVQRDEVETIRLEYWDYWREVKDEAGQAVRQYLFVEMDTQSGWFQIWRGQEVDAQQVIVF
jgi:hypothetical protein